MTSEEQNRIKARFRQIYKIEAGYRTIAEFAAAVGRSESTIANGLVSGRPVHAAIVGFVLAWDMRGAKKPL